MPIREKTVALLPGSFDPVTIGHGQLMLDGARMFDEMHIVMAVNPAKKYLFDDTAREALLRAVVADMDFGGTPVHVHFMKGRLLAHVARDLGATHLLRGIRDSVDFAYEEKQSVFNRKINPHLRTVYLTLPELGSVSSSGVRDVFGLDGWPDVVGPDVHPLVLDALRRLHIANSRSRTLVAVPELP